MKDYRLYELYVGKIRKAGKTESYTRLMVDMCNELKMFLDFERG